MAAAEEENYDFCSHFDIYITGESWLNQDSYITKYTYSCELMEAEFSKKKTEFKDICTKFNFLLDKLIYGHESALAGDYMNFWLNYEFKRNNRSKVPITDFYNSWKKNVNNSLNNKHILKDKMRDIKEPHLKNMETDYEEAIKSCSEKNNYCEALVKFKKKIENLISLSSSHICQLKGSLSMPPYRISLIEKEENREDSGDNSKDQLVLEEDTNSTHFSNTLAPIFSICSVFLVLLILYKRTPFGSIIHQRILKQKKNMTDFEHNEEESLFKNDKDKKINEDNNQFNIQYHLLQNS
ncbi:PIR Superfamily Protein [Plasmodium ovale curtisi]|uniref:PIR Superfamily Protein n=1 Tax=Plasmodium ovale curtisi TaxID=864141 RepID=A0A1A8WBJ8_PLAOA|nr:PIR Superfamily Protein [Plasmodium ovale curtisi]